jgi:hypothetical protein
MRIASEDESNRCRPWQFTLRSLMIGVFIFGVILSCGSWLGIRGYIGALLTVTLGMLGFAIYKRRKLLAIFCVVLIAGPVLYFYYGYWTIAKLACSICGKEQNIIFIGNINGIKCYSKEQETDLSKWYRDVGLKPHVHQWHSVWWNVHNWGGQPECYDSFYFFLDHLRLLHDVSEKVDRATFEEILKDYQIRQQDPKRASMFYDRCEQIMSTESQK